MSDVALIDNLTRLATAMGDEVTKIRELLNGDRATLSDLATSDKSNLVAAINELKSAVGTGVVALLDDGAPKPNKTWSSSKISQQIISSMDGALADVRGNVPSGLNTLAKIAQSLGNSTDLIGLINTGLSKRVRVDSDSQGLTISEKANARKNIDAASLLDVGADIDLVSVFRTGLRTDLL